ncbi:MAG TPA: DNA polymerase III subunit gamma/tau [Patescibacteria group bacterium]
MTLYLKYRPQTIGDLDSEKVRTTLKKIVSGNNLPHAFLFAGPKGTGKTSAARILAKLINCEKPAKENEPCNKCNQCTSTTNGSNMDVIELDAASNRGIDDVRALKDNIILSPVAGKKKIYIIDEAHMLTTEASNAFLKTLEEPPAHVIFILATTNPEKLPATVTSRLSTVVFEKAGQAEIANKLKKVVVGEKLKADEGVVEVIAKAADGSFRDAIKILEQLSSQTDSIDIKIAQDYIVRNKVLSPSDFLEIISSKNTKLAIEKIEQIAATGGSIRNFMDLLIAKLHEEILAKNGVGVSEFLSLTKLLYDAKRDLHVTPIEQLPLEVAVIKWCSEADPLPKSPQALSKKEEPKEEIVQKVTINIDSASSQISKKKELEDELKQIEKEKPQVPDLNLPNKDIAVGDEVGDDVWHKILENVRTKNTSIEALLRAAHPIGFDGQTLTLGVYYQFHKERLEVLQNRKTLEDVLCITFGKPLIKVSYKLTERKNNPALPKKPDLLTKTQDKDIIDAAREIFGS